MSQTKSTAFTPNLQRFTDTERQRIMAADAFAQAAHVAQRRKSGEPYINHPRAVAAYLDGMGVDADTIIAGLLHDTVEDTAVTAEDIETEFGPTVRTLVEGVTKLGQVEYVQSEDVSEQRHATSVENLRKLLLAMSKDMRVLIIKLADRRHNLQTLGALNPENRLRIASESLEVFAPLADRLGMGVLKAEIEDMAFEYANPQAYRLVRRLVLQNATQAQSYITELKTEVGKLMQQNKVEVVSIDGRQKHLYSVYRKLNKTEGDITKIYDLMALRLIVPTINDCYQVLGILHQQYKPLIYRIKDYIAVPKPNGYRSLHTTVFAKHGRIIEMQIRTPEMHKEAEQGLAAHSLYNVHKDSKAYRSGDANGMAASKKLSWIQELAGLSAEGEPGTELMDNLRIDLFRDRIFVFSPKGDLYDLPEGATAVDFAFAVHTDVGLRTQGARVNGRIMPLDRPLENRDVVEIITRKQQAPNRQWLVFVKTAGARSRIKSWFRAASREANITTGRQILEAQLPTWGYKKLEEVGDVRIKAALEALNLKDLDMMLASVGDGSLTLTTALRRLLPPVTPPTEKTQNHVKKTTGRMQVVGAPELPCYPAACCDPQPPAQLIGYITRGNGVTVHRSDCGNIPDEPDRLLDCQWEITSEDGATIPVKLEIMCRNRMGLVHDITGLILSRRINIVRIITKDIGEKHEQSLLTIMVEVGDLFALNALTQQLHVFPDVQKVTPTVVGVDLVSGTE